MGYLHGIQIKEGAKNVLMSAGDTSVIALVGTAPQGAVGTVKLITSAEAAVYNRQNEKCNFEKRKVHFLVFSGHFGRVCLTAVQSSLKRCLIG